MSELVFYYISMQAVVAFALETLRERSPVGSTGDAHPGLYRDSHTVFIDGHNVADASGWKRGQQVNIANSVPYSRKIELGQMKLRVPAHVYEMSAPIVAGRFGNIVNCRFVYMPVSFGGVADFAAFSKKIRPGRRMNEKARQEWLSRQPALEITSR